MEFKDPGRYKDRRPRINVPERGSSLFGNNKQSSQDSTPKDTVEIPKDLKGQRESFGFDDIPVGDEDMEHVRFRDILKAWGKQGIKHSSIEKGIEKATSDKGRLHKLKNDLKWAMQADLDEPVAPKPKNHKQATKPISPERVVITKHINAQQPATDPSKSIDININFGSLPKLPAFPSVAKLASSIRPMLLSKKGIAGGIVLVVVIGSYVGLNTYIQQQTNAKTDSTTSRVQRPTYTTVLPSGKSIDSLGGWKKVSPDTSAAAYAYADKIDGVVINVTQQQLPDSFKEKTDDKVAELAKGFSANDKIDTGSTPVYVGTSADGPQSAILVKNNTLVLIKSQSKIADTSWAKYAESLK